MSDEKMNQTKRKVILFYPTIPGVWKYVWFPFPYIYLGPFLERAGYTVKIIDARVDENWAQVLLREINDAVCFGVTGMTGPDLSNAIEACNIVREAQPHIPIIWGGHHANQLPEQILNEGVGDYVFTGPGEFGLSNLLDLIQKGAELDSFESLIYAQNGIKKGVKSFTPIDFGYDIFPAYHLLDIEKYRSPNNIVSYFSSRGCPYHCTFCTTGDFFHSNRSVPQFIREIDYLVKDLGFHNIFFQDGTFFISKERVMTIAQKMKELGPEVKWKAKARANSLLNYSKADLDYLHDSGLRSIFFGIESGSPKILKIMKKNIVPQQAIDSARLCSEFDFEFYVSFMYAVPGETIDDLKQTIALIREIKSINPKATVQNSVYIPLPGTSMYNMCLELGYQPPNTMAEWAERDISSNFEKRTDINWIKPSILKEYVRIYNDEFPDYKHVFEREKEGKYASPLSSKQSE
jgi:radical SAM superfamily enzyme YgiQ (UPF0313 family)|tara:strand:- start:90 stop:1475 length:1386 start_codon:yes stop_codon:yes gene_type:complete